jgi:L-lactate utilization protein LutB
MSDLMKWHNEVIGQRVIDALNKNNFNSNYFDSRQEAVDYILQLIPLDATIGVGGSRTAVELGLVELLEKRGHELFNHNQDGLTPEEKIERRYKQLTCDVFLSGANAITLTGEIVNRDAFGNRAAAMMFGPKKVIIVVGTNKIVRDVAEADQRIKLYAAPMNNKRYESPNPCVQLGECVDCKSPTRACNITTILSRRPPLTDIHIIVLGETLGF